MAAAKRAPELFDSHSAAFLSLNCTPGGRNRTPGSARLKTLRVHPYDQS